MLFKSFIFSETSFSIPGILSDEKLLLTFDKVSLILIKFFIIFFFSNSSNSPELHLNFLVLLNRNHMFVLFHLIFEFFKFTFVRFSLDFKSSQILLV